MTRSTFRPQTVAEVAKRATTGRQPFDLAVREFIDTWQDLSAEEKRLVLAEEPVSVGRVEDAYVAAVAEHLSAIDRIDAPSWTEAPHRFLHEPYFAGGLQSLKAILIVESPSAFRRRLIFVSADALSRPPRTATRRPAGMPPVAAASLKQR